MANNSSSGNNNCICEQVITLLNKSIKLYNKYAKDKMNKLLEIKGIVKNNVFEWNIENNTTNKIIKIDFSDIVHLCGEQIYIVDFLIHYAFSQVQMYTQNGECSVQNVQDINTSIVNKINVLKTFSTK